MTFNTNIHPSISTTPINCEMPEVIKKAIEVVSDSCAWLGHKIVVGYQATKNFIVKTWNKALPVIKEFFTNFIKFLRTGPGLCCAFLLLGVSLYAAGDSVNKRSLSLALRIAGIACFITAGVFLGVGLMSGFGTALI